MLFYLRRHFRLIALIILLLGTAMRLWDVFHGWSSISGGEPFLVAQSLAGGHGFSASSNHRWMFKDFVPVYPGLMAIAFVIFGAVQGKLAILVFQVTALALTSVVVYYLGKRLFSSQTGILAASILAMWPSSN